MIRTLSLICGALSLWAGAAIADCKLVKVAELPVTMAGDPMVEAKINGRTLHFVADSGAFFSLVSPAVAKQLGLKTFQPPGGLMLEGFGGEAETSVTRPKDFEFAGIKLNNVDFLVAGNAIGAGIDGLLGQNVLSYADVEYDLANGVIRLWQPTGCGDAMLAYWRTKDQPFSQLILRSVKLVRHTAGSVTINGHVVTAMFDTGAGKSYVGRNAAQRAGIDLKGPGVKPAETIAGGIGLRTFDTVIAPVQSFKIGDDEEIRNTRLRVGDGDILNFDMIIGADFFLSHRIYVSNAQQRMYFTYNGGPVFNLSSSPSAQSASVAKAPAITAASDTALDASAFARRGDASAERGDYASAIADLTRARAAAPDNPDFAFERAGVYARQGRTDLAMADADDAIRLRSDNALALMLRAELWIAKPDNAKARADIDAAARIVPKPSNERVSLGQLYVQAQAPDAAIGQYDLWLQNHPHDVGRVDALNGRCWARAILGQELSKALADCDAALSFGGKTAAILDSRGLVHLRLGEFDKAIADYGAALAIKPKMPWSLYGRGIARLRLGRSADGKADIAAAVALDPKLPATAKGYGVTP